MSVDLRPALLAGTDWSSKPAIQWLGPETVERLITERLEESANEHKSSGLFFKKRDSAPSEDAMRAHYVNNPPLDRLRGMVGWYTDHSNDALESGLIESQTLAQSDTAMTDKPSDIRQLASLCPSLQQIQRSGYSYSADDQNARFIELKNRSFGDIKAKALEVCSSTVKEMGDIQRKRYGTTWLDDNVPGEDKTFADAQGDALGLLWDKSFEMALWKLKKEVSGILTSQRKTEERMGQPGETIDYHLGAGKALLTLDGETLRTDLFFGAADSQEAGINGSLTLKGPAYSVQTAEDYTAQNEVRVEEPSMYRKIFCL
ncbi:uncharacterized protein I303_107119 [Kwoniella dejecticola CBS 10117]|uniref:Uncharacterized protein n=1 Tax=Kwoniella dejecticola CBS 10117 TaxID=1296121 RepID=A0A1A5ZYT2_9TREE|nr:uncharacterized protein I303_06521 [Kwoniella dejecticola CBS 10117]OBR82963.1 hypothetical protein I303_06521 [Kwoniella dejecticola CBS 10117]